MKSNILSKIWKPLLAVTFWGASFIATKTALGQLTPRNIILIRLLLGTSFLFIIALFTKRNFRIKWKSLSSIFILALIATFHLWIQVTGLKFTTATNTGWIIGVTPVFMAILGLIFFREKLNLLQISGIAVSFFGLLLLISKGNINGLGIISHKGDFLVLASAVTWSIYSIVNKKITLEYSPFMTILFLFLLMITIILPFNINKELINSINHLALKVWASVIFLGIFCSGISYVLWAQALKELAASKVGVFLYFEPFVTVFAAWLILNEKITVLIMLSGIIITTGVFLVNRNKN